MIVTDWIAVLREQAQNIGKEGYQPDPALFNDAPEDIAQLGGDLNVLALQIEERRRLQQVLTHEVHHRVKNNLQIVTSLLSLQAGKIADRTARAALLQTRARMSALALIHRMLYERSDDSTQGQIDIARLLHEVCAQLRLMHIDAVHVQFSCHADTQNVPLDNAVPLILFVVEAITNAYCHAFPRSRPGEIILRFRVTDGMATVFISDDGIGHDTSGNFSTMGHQLMTAFTQQLAGTLNVESTPDVGTVVTLTYPITTAS